MSAWAKDWSDFYGYAGHLFENFLTARVGHKWDDIYSEICRSYTKKRDRFNADHYVDVYVEQTVVMIDGKPYDYGFYSYGSDDPRPITSSGSPGSFYVNPETGTLEIAPLREKKKDIDNSDTHVDLGGNKHANAVDGIWYLVTAKPIPEYEWALWTDRQKCKRESLRDSQGDISNYSAYHYYFNRYANDYGHWFIPEYKEDVVAGCWHIYKPGSNKYPSIYFRHGTGFKRSLYIPRDFYVAKVKQMSTQELKRYGLKNR
jgi:hypothetical protein